VEVTGEDTGDDETDEPDAYDYTGSQNDTDGFVVRNTLIYMYVYVQDVYISIILCPLSYPICSLIYLELPC